MNDEVNYYLYKWIGVAKRDWNRIIIGRRLWALWKKHSRATRVSGKDLNCCKVWITRLIQEIWCNSAIGSAKLIDKKISQSKRYGRRFQDWRTNRGSYTFFSPIVDSLAPHKIFAVNWNNFRLRLWVNTRSTITRSSISTSRSVSYRSMETRNKLIIPYLGMGSGVARAILSLMSGLRMKMSPPLLIIARSLLSCKIS